ncbi:MAG: GYDIA family GHMP kinase [Bacteroidota bacterium]
MDSNISTNRSFSAQGKLLLSGEYFVLDGALALALPARYGQHMEISEIKSDQPILYWESLDEQGLPWLKASFSLPQLSLLSTSDEAITKRLIQLLQKSRLQQASFLQTTQSLKVRTTLDFPRNWGLGTSSTLLYNLAQWAQIDPYQLLADTFGGSGYDIACAAAKGPIFYQRIAGKANIQAIEFAPSYSHQLYFVYLGQKQNSREGIARYRSLLSQPTKEIEAISQITQALSHCPQLSVFEELLRTHEQIIASSLQIPRARDLYFSDYWGEIKSLGAWGGDFVLATSKRSPEATQAYFADKGMKTILSYQDMVL